MGTGMLKDPRAKTALLVCLCFLTSTTGYLSWLDRVLTLADPSRVERFAIVLAYLFQAAGIGVYLLAAGRSGGRKRRCRTVAVAALLLQLAVLPPATMTENLAATLAFGYFANACCGMVQGHYLAVLCQQVQRNRRGIVFGIGYGASTLATWLLSLPAGGALTAGAPSLVLCGLLTFATLPFLLADRTAADADADRRRDILQAPSPAEISAEEDDGAGGKTKPGVYADATSTSGTSTSAPVDTSSAAGAIAGDNLSRGTVLLACAAIFAACVMHTAGFSFPSSDLDAGVNLQLSRILYGVGVVVTGIVCDRSRRLGLVMCAASLVMPFLMLALSGADASSALLWLFGYLLTGVYVPFCVLLAADLADDAGRPDLAGTGMLARHVADSLGTALYLSLAHAPVALIVILIALFAVTTALFLLLDRMLYAPQPPTVSPEQLERARFERFSADFGLSARERDVLRLVLEEKSNPEIAAELVLAERTVKFHMTNLLKKTGCKTRLEVLAKYASYPTTPGNPRFGT